MKPRFRSLVLDVDSTLCGVEGIDWLAERRGPDVATRVRALTGRAMTGDIPLDAVYGERLALIRPSERDIAALADVYLATMAPDAAAAVAELKLAGTRVVLVSGGIRRAIAPLANALGIELAAVDLRFTAEGEYAGFDEGSPLTRQDGKRAVVASLHLGRPAVAVGDGATDVFMREAVDAFWAYTGFAARPPVVERADAVVGSFAELRARVW